MVGFLDLPREIRDLCYELAFQVSGTIFIYSSDFKAYRPRLRGRIVEYSSGSLLQPERINKCIPIGFIKTCRQMHAECTAVLYSRNSFRLYMDNADFAAPYRPLIRHVTFTLEAGRGIYSHNPEVMCYWWRRVFWPNVIDTSTKILHNYPNLQRLTLPIKSNDPSHIWRPAFFSFGHITKEQRTAQAAQWLRLNCPINNDRLRQVLRLEIQQSASFLKMMNKTNESFRLLEEEDEDYWDGSELAQAWEKSL